MRTRTLVDLCAKRAAAEPRRRAFTFLADGRTEWDHLTLGELDRRSRALAALLAQLAPPGERALLCFEPGLDFHVAFLGCLYAGLIAVPVAPLDGTRAGLKVNKVESVVSSAEPTLLLSTGLTFAKIQDLVAETAALKTLVQVIVDEVDPGLAPLWTRPDIGAETVAYLQYSSGSTGAPKGVTLTHGNVMHNLSVIHENLRRLSDEDGLPRPPTVSWLPLHYNMGLIGGVLEPLFSQRDATLIPAKVFVRSPISWLRAISSLGRVDSAAPNFALELCVRRITAAQRDALDLSGWEMVLIGGEPVRAGTLDRFCEMFEPAGFRREALVPGYGLAEATVMVSCAYVGQGPVILRVDPEDLANGRARPVDPPGGRRLVSSGPVPPNVKVDAADGMVGEILVSGPSVGKGYWNAPSEAFGRKYLHTGDLGFVYDGELFVTGRAKEVIIVAGANHHPHDIEATVEASHPAVVGCCAMSVDDGERERVVVLAEVVTDMIADEIEMAIRRSVHFGHGIQVHEVRLLAARSLPLTSSGKLQRRACRDAYVAGEFGSPPNTQLSS